MSNKYDSYKDSGVEWIGDIPNHWHVKRLKNIGSLYTGLSGKSGSDFEKVPTENLKPFINFTNIANNKYIVGDNFGFVKINENENQNQVKKNDLFFLMSSENQEDVGKSALLLNDYDELYLNSFCKGFRLTINSDARFIKDYAQEVVEIGLVNETAHRIDEYAWLSEIDQLSEVYFEILKSLNLSIS